MHEKIEVNCDFGVSEKCKKQCFINDCISIKTRNYNYGKNICNACSKTLKTVGRSKSKSNFKIAFDDNFFNIIDSEGKAYLLGWIASVGDVAKNNVVSIRVHKKDVKIFNSFNDILGTIIISKPEKNSETTVFSFCSRQATVDIYKHLKISPEKKNHDVEFPKELQNNEKLGWVFVRGVFDGDSSFVKQELPYASITSFSTSFRKDIFDFCKIPADNSDKTNQIQWQSSNAIDFLGKIYDGANYFLERKEELYCQWRSWVPGLQGYQVSAQRIEFKCVKTRNDAVLPTKTNPTDSGYDVTILEKVKQVSDVEYYDTGIKAQCSFGYWLMLVPRSSMSKTGYTMANSIGIIDRTYTGNILVALRKVNKDAEDLTLPCRIAQLIPMPAVHCGPAVWVDSLDNTARNDGGFGSSGK